MDGLSDNSWTCTACTNLNDSAKKRCGTSQQEYYHRTASASAKTYPKQILKFWHDRIQSKCWNSELVEKTDVPVQEPIDGGKKNKVHWTIVDPKQILKFWTWVDPHLPRLHWKFEWYSFRPLRAPRVRWVRGKILRNLCINRKKWWPCISVGVKTDFGFSNRHCECNKQGRGQKYCSKFSDIIWRSLEIQ